MVRMSFVWTLVAGVLIGSASEAAATPYTLPHLGLTLELPATPEWGPEPSKYGPGDMLQSHTELRVQVDIVHVPGVCLQWATGMIETLHKQGATTRFVARPPWIPAPWLAAISEFEMNDGLKQLSWCRDLGNRRADGSTASEPSSLVVMAFVQPGADARGLVGSVMSALEAQLRRNGVPTVPIEFSDAELLAGLNEDLEKLRRPVATVPAAVAPRPDPGRDAPSLPDRPARASTHRRSDESRDDRPRRPARFDGLRVAVDLAALSLEGDSVQEGNRIGASVALPLRYRRSGAKAGWVYGGRLAAGRIGDLVVGSGHGAIGFAVGKPHSQGALVMVVGGDRAPAGSPLATQDGGFAGLQVLLRFPLDRITILEATATLVAGSHGGSSSLELSLVTTRFSSLSVLAGVERRSWDDGMSSLGAQLGIGF